jgi:hypothetical protein
VLVVSNEEVSEDLAAEIGRLTTELGGLNNFTARCIRVWMPDPAKLTPELLQRASKGYILEVPAFPSEHFLGIVNVPCLMDILGGAVGGPVGYAFITYEDAAPKDKAKHWFISMVPNDAPWALPERIMPVPRGVSVVAGTIHAHFELVDSGYVNDTSYMEKWLELMQKLDVVLMPAKKYAPPKDLLDALKLVRV